MNDVTDIKVSENYVFLDTGSPHHVEFVNELKNYNVEKEGASIRYNTYGKAGANINFVEAIDKDSFAVRTYERGVEAETLSCGTGVAAVAIALFEINKTSSNNVILNTKGGVLNVVFNKTKAGYSDVYLKGPATKVFKGTWI
jgi:diaminopimelate epimerase